MELEWASSLNGIQALFRPCTYWPTCGHNCGWCSAWERVTTLLYLLKYSRATDTFWFLASLHHELPFFWGSSRAPAKIHRNESVTGVLLRLQTFPVLSYCQQHPFPLALINIIIENLQRCKSPTFLVFRKSRQITTTFIGPYKTHSFDRPCIYIFVSLAVLDTAYIEWTTSNRARGTRMATWISPSESSFITRPCCTGMAFRFPCFYSFTLHRCGTSNQLWRFRCLDFTRKCT